MGITPAQIASASDADKATGHKTDFIFPWGVGCIRYRSPDGIFHQTGIAFTIVSIKPGIDLPVALPVDPTTVDPKLLFIEKWIEGGSAYAN